jgi:hypothetical protein
MQVIRIMQNTKIIFILLSTSWGFTEEQIRNFEHPVHDTCSRTCDPIVLKLYKTAMNALTGTPHHTPARSGRAGLRHRNLQRLGRMMLAASASQTDSLFAAACCGCNPAAAAASTVFFPLWIAAAAIQTAATVSACSQPNTPWRIHDKLKVYLTNDDDSSRSG